MFKLTKDNNVYHRPWTVVLKLGMALSQTRTIMLKLSMAQLLTRDNNLQTWYGSMIDQG